MCEIQAPWTRTSLLLPEPLQYLYLEFSLQVPFMRGAGNSLVPKPPLLLPGIHPPQQRLFHKEQCPETITALEQKTSFWASTFTEALLMKMWGGKKEIMFSWHFGLENVSINQGNPSLSQMKSRSCCKTRKTTLLKEPNCDRYVPPVSFHKKGNKH